MKKHITSQKGQALVGGLFLLVFTLLFCSYFLFASESYFHLFSNAEESNADTVKILSYESNILNEISFNNQNILASLTVAQNALLKSIEWSLYISFHQPYWETNDILKSGRFLGANRLTDSTKKGIYDVFDSYSMNSGRGLFLAKSLVERNKILLSKLPQEISQYFIQSANEDSFCFALRAEKENYKVPGILNLPVFPIYSFHLNQNTQHPCKIEHKTNGFYKMLEFSLPMIQSSEKDEVLNYSSFAKLLSNNNTELGVTFVRPENQQIFYSSLHLISKSKIQKPLKAFTILNHFFAHLPFFVKLKLDEPNLLNQSPLTNEFFITHNEIICSHPEKPSSCSLNNSQFLKLFFEPHWSVSGNYL